MAHSERRAIGCYRRRGAQPEPSTGREGREPLSFPGEGAAAAGATAGGHRGPEESALPFPRETTLGAVIAQPLHNFDPRCVPLGTRSQTRGSGKTGRECPPCPCWGRVEG